MNDFWSGLALVTAAGVMGGSFTVPLKFVRGWSWERSWLLYSEVGMVLVPWLLVALIVPHPADVYRNVSGAELARTALFGVGWGVGSVLFGLGVTRVGTALAFAIVVSLTAILGALVPLAILQPEDLTRDRTLWLLLGLVIVLVGLSLCAGAGFLKESAQKKVSTPQVVRVAGGFLTGLLICLVAGLTSPMFNFSLAFGQGIQLKAQSAGANGEYASVAVIAVAVSAGFLSNAAYCLYLLVRNHRGHSADDECGPRNGILVIVMGLLWMFGMFCYGVGASRMGPRGPVLGWPLFMTLMVLTGNFWGTVTGEWRGAGRRAYGLLQLGNLAMVLAFVVISMASRPAE